MQKVHERVNELLEAGVIRQSCFPFLRPRLLLRKTALTVYMYRELNANTVLTNFCCHLFLIK